MEVIRLKILDKIIFPLALALVVSIAGLAVRIAVPVSYTHLDVYKRQR